MCQAYEGESAYLVQRDLEKIRKRFKDHEEGEKVLTDDELRTLAANKLILEER